MIDRPRSSKCAFTITEVLVVVLIVMALLAILLPAIQMVRQRAKRTQVESTASLVISAMTVYRQLTLGYPPQQTFPDVPFAQTGGLSTRLSGQPARGLLDVLGALADLRVPMDLLGSEVSGYRPLVDPWGVPMYYQYVDPLGSGASASVHAFWRGRGLASSGAADDEAYPIVYSVGGPDNHADAFGSAADGSGRWVDPEGVIAVNGGG